MSSASYGRPRKVFSSRKTFRAALETFVEVSFGVKEPADRDDFVRMLYLIRDGPDKVVDEVLACTQLGPPHNDDDRDEVDKKVTAVARTYEKVLEGKDMTPDTDQKLVAPATAAAAAGAAGVVDFVALAKAHKSELADSVAACDQHVMPHAFCFVLSAGYQADKQVYLQQFTKCLPILEILTQAIPSLTTVFQSSLGAIQDQCGLADPTSYSETHAIEDSMANMHLAPAAAANAPLTAPLPPTVADRQPEPEPTPAMQPPSLLGQPPSAASAPAVTMTAHQQQQQVPPLLPFLTQGQQPQPYYVPLFPATRKTLPVTAFVDFLRTVSFSIVFEFAAALYSSSPAVLRDADGDIRKYLFHISRHTAVISGVAKVPVDGVSAGIFLFRIGAHSESVPETRFRTLVREYITFLEHIEIRKPDGYVVRFADRNVVLAKVEAVDFPGGMTFPIMHEARDFAKVEAGQRPRTYDGKDSTYMSDDLVRPAPTINVRELHRRQLCMACRHFLRGMCYRGDSCNFCHDKEHQVQLEHATSDLRTVLPKTAEGAARLQRNQKAETS